MRVLYKVTSDNIKVLRLCTDYNIINAKVCFKDGKNVSINYLNQVLINCNDGFVGFCTDLESIMQVKKSIKDLISLLDK